MKIFVTKIAIYTALILFSLPGCEPVKQAPSGPVYEKSTANEKATYHLAIHPLHNPRKLIQAYQPLVDLLNREIPQADFILEASRDYQAFETKFRDRKPELILPNPWQTLEAIKVGYRVISMAGDAEDFKGIFIVRKDSHIKTPSDLKGKIVSYPSHTALAACIMPQRYLHEHGLDIHRDIENRYVGSQESSIMNALLGEVSAGATWPPPWRLFQKSRPEEAAQLKVIWETPYLLNNSFMVRNDVPETIIQQISQQLFNLHTSEKGKLILKGMETARFYPADNDSYIPVKNFISDFEKDIRPVEQP